MVLYYILFIIKNIHSKSQINIMIHRLYVQRLKTVNYMIG